MSKKKKLHHSDGPKPLISKKLRRRLIRLFFLCTLAAVSYAFYDPKTIPDKNIQGKVESMREEALDYLSNTQNKIPNSLPIKLATADILDKLPKGAVLGDEQIDVESLFSLLTSKLKNLPQHQVNQIKRDLCSDLIYEATTSSKQQ